MLNKKESNMNIVKLTNTEIEHIVNNLDLQKFNLQRELSNLSVVADLQERKYINNQIETIETAIHALMISEKEEYVESVIGDVEF
jgi:hypothetical protein